MSAGATCAGHAGLQRRRPLSAGATLAGHAGLQRRSFARFDRGDLDRRPWFPDPAYQEVDGDEDVQEVDEDEDDEEEPQEQVMEEEEGEDLYGFDDGALQEPPGTSTCPSPTGIRLREHRLRQEATERVRADQLERSSRELLHRHLYHMGQANDWAAELGLPTRYCVRRCEDGQIRCHMYEDEKFKREISLELFERRYRSLLASRQQRRMMQGKSSRPVGSLTSSARPPCISPQEQAFRQEEVRRKRKEVDRLRATLELQRQQLWDSGMPIIPFVVIR